MNKFNETSIFIEDPINSGKIITITCHIFKDDNYKVYEYFRISDLSDITNTDSHVFKYYEDKVHEGFIEPINIIRCFYYNKYSFDKPPYIDNNKPIVNENRFKDFILRLLESSVNVHWHQQSMAYSTYIHDLALANDKNNFDDCFN